MSFIYLDLILITMKMMMAQPKRPETKRHTLVMMMMNFKILIRNGKFR
jgi:hypothetical protein